VPVPHPMTGLPTTRRTALGGAVAGLLLATGCDHGDDDDAGAVPTQTEPPVDADAELVEQARTRITAADTVLEELVRQHPKLRRELRPLRALHEGHAEVLGGFVDRAVIPARFDLQGSRAYVRRTEMGMQRHLTNAAVAAESGALAKLLASMAAGVAQHLAALG
jgi:hypothetical protein